MTLWSGRHRWILIGLLFVAVMVTIQLLWLASPDRMRVVTRVNALLYDARFNALPPQRAHRLPIVIVDLDEFSLKREGRWPWSREKIAQLIKEIRASGALLIGLDMVFSEPGRNAVRQVLKTTQLPPTLHQRLLQEVDALNSDKVLAEAVSERTVLGYFFHNNSVSAGQLPFPFYRLNPENAEHNALLTMHSYTANLPVLANHALGEGFVVTVPSMDGVVRRVPLVIRYKKGVYSSLSLEMARLALGAHWIKLTLVNNGNAYVATHINVGNKVIIPVSANGSMLVPFRGYAGSFPTLSATRVMHGDLPADQKQALKGAIVLVGTTALGLSDLRTIPLQTAYPGVEVHANVLDAILQAAMGVNTFYRQPDWSPAFSLMLLLLTGVLLACLLPGRSPRWMLILTAIWLLFVLGLNSWLWAIKQLALPFALQLVTVIGLAAFNLTVGFVETNRNKREVEGLFGEYVPPDYVKMMLTQPEKATMEGEQREMTVLFADVCGFTSLSESLTTTELKSLLNRYLTEVTGIIFQHQGTIDKYVGDMVMAFWNAPLDDRQHAPNGVLAALDMQRKVTELRQQFITEGIPPLAIGIGLNTGLMNVGDMGSSYRRAYTVLGDAVNLGSRLEGLTRFYGVDVLISDATRNQCKDVLCCPIDRIRVKGKNEPVDVFEPLCLYQDATNVQRHRVEVFERALAAYRHREFEQAEQGLRDLRLAEPDGERDKLICCYLDRITEFNASPPPHEWQAVFTHTSK